MPSGEQFGAFQFYSDAWGSDSWEIVDNEVISDSALLYAINNSPARTFTANAVSGNDILLTDNTSNRDFVIRSLYIGALLRRTNTITIGRVTGIDFNGSSQWVISGTWSGTLAASETWTFLVLQNLLERGTRMRGSAVMPIVREQRPWELGLQRGNACTIRFGGRTWTPSQSIDTLPINGHVTAIRARCSRPYTGPDAWVALFVYLKNEAGTQIQYIDMEFKAGTGHAFTDAVGNSESGTGNSALANLPGAQFTSEANINVYHAGVPATGTSAQMPVFDVEIDISPAC